MAWQGLAPLWPNAAVRTLRVKSLDEDHTATHITSLTIPANESQAKAAPGRRTPNMLAQHNLSKLQGHVKTLRPLARFASLRKNFCSDKPNNGESS